MLAWGKLSRDAMAHSRGGDYIGLEFSGRVGRLYYNLATSRLTRRLKMDIEGSKSGDCSCMGLVCSTLVEAVSK